ncbi:hypothetical protein [Coxiella-like endosymbiont]
MVPNEIISLETLRLDL